MSYRTEDGWSHPNDAYLEIEGDRIGGTMGVNRVMGSLDEHGLPGPLATTLMAGPPRLMEQEQQLLRHLGESDSVVVGKQGMTVLHQGLPLVEFTRSGTDGDHRSS